MWPFSKKLEDVVCPTKTVRVHGVKFKIKKLDPSNYLDGSRVMLQEYDTYKVKPNNEAAASNVLEKTKDHFRDVFMSSVIDPKLKRKESDPEGLFVDYLFTEWDLANELYTEILYLTYGKKNLKRALSLVKKS